MKYGPTLFGKDLDKIQLIACSCPTFKRGKLENKKCRCMIDAIIKGKKKRIGVNVPANRVIVAKRVL